MADKKKDIKPTELKIKIYKDEGYWMVEDDEFGFVGVGDTLEEALMRFGIDIQVTYDIRKVKDELLSEDGKKLKKKLKDAFGRWLSEEARE